MAKTVFLLSQWSFTRNAHQRPSLLRPAGQGYQDQDGESSRLVWAVFRVGWAVLSGVLGAEMEEPAALGSLFQPLSWLLVHFLAEVCSATHPDPSFATSGNPEGPFSPQEPFGAWGSGSETSLLQPLLLLLLFCCKSCPDGNHVLHLLCPRTESWEVSYISSQGHSHLEHCLFQLLAAA